MFIAGHNAILGVSVLGDMNLGVSDGVLFQSRIVEVTENTIKIEDQLPQDISIYAQIVSFNEIYITPKTENGTY